MSEGLSVGETSIPAIIFLMVYCRTIQKWFDVQHIMESSVNFDTENDCLSNLTKGYVKYDDCMGNEDEQHDMIYSRIHLIRKQSCRSETQTS